MALRLEGKLRDRTVAHLAELILAGRWQIGEYLPPEAELVQELGISRSAFREALSQLEARGLVEVRQGVGTRVAEKSQEAVAESLALLLRRSHAAARDLLETRRILEEEAAALAAQRATPEALLALGAALEDMRTSADSPEAYTRGDLEFHLRLVLASQNAILGAVAAGLRAAIRDSIAASFDADRSDARLDGRLADHRRILEAVESGDPDAARAAVVNHYQGTESTLRQLGRIGRGDVDGPEPGGHPRAPARGRRRRTAAKGPETTGSV